MNAKQVYLTDEVALNKGWHMMVFLTLALFRQFSALGAS